MLVIQSQYSPARWPKPDAYHISFTNGTAVQPLTDGVILGGSMQVHSREAGHRYYTVLFEEQGTVEEHCRLSGVSGGGIKAPGAERATDHRRKPVSAIRPRHAQPYLTDENLTDGR